MVGMVGDEDGHDAASSVERSGTVAGSRRNRTRTEVENVVGDLLARFGSFAAAEVSERVTGVGEKTVRRYLAEMVKGGQTRLCPARQADDLSGRKLGRRPRRCLLIPGLLEVPVLLAACGLCRKVADR